MESPASVHHLPLQLAMRAELPGKVTMEEVKGISVPRPAELWVKTCSGAGAVRRESGKNQTDPLLLLQQNVTVWSPSCSSSATRNLASPSCISAERWWWEGRAVQCEWCV